MCIKCVEDSIVNRNNAKATRDLAYAAGALPEGPVKQAVLERLANLVRLPQTDANQVTDGEVGQAEAAQPNLVELEANVQRAARRLMAARLGVPESAIDVVSA